MPTAPAIAAGSMNFPSRLMTEIAPLSERLRRPIRCAIRANVFAAIAPILDAPRMIGPTKARPDAATGCATGPVATGRFALGCARADTRDEPKLNA